MTFLSQKTGQFTYFASQLADFDWRGKDVMDFGGNIGNILRDPISLIDETRYWCLDVDDAALSEGRKSYPRAHWIQYDRYCFFFNPGGIRGLRLPDLRTRFDYIVAYSVFPNMGPEDMLDLVPQLRRLLVDDGKLAFTFIDPHHHSWPDSYDGNNLCWRLGRERGENPTIDVDRLMGSASDAEWCILVNGDDIYVETDEIRTYAPDEQRTFHVFHAEQYVRHLFPEGVILPPTNKEMQHCCILRGNP